VDQLDLTDLMQSYELGDGRGQPPYHPAMMVKLLLYAYCVGVPASRKIARGTHRDVAFRVLAGDQHPGHDSIAEFRRRHLDRLAGLFLQVLRLCQAAGLVTLGQVALDGTKVQANASRHKAMSYARLEGTERRLEGEVRRLLDEADRVDAAEDAQYGPGRRGDELPAELARRETRLAAIRAAKAALEQQARARADPRGDRRAAAGADARASRAQRRAAPGGGDGGRRLLQRREPDERGRRGDRSVCAARQAAARHAAVGGDETMPHRHGRGHAREAGHSARPRCLRAAQSNRRTRLRADQSGAGLPTLFVSRAR